MRCDDMIRQKWMRSDEMCRIAKKATYYSVDLLLVFQKLLLIRDDTIHAWNSVYHKIISFF